MRVTNVYGLPETLVKAVTFDDRPGPRPRNRLSVTRLITPVRIAALTERHNDEIVDDAANRIWMLMGTAIHGVLQRADSADSLKEQYFRERYGAYEVSGMCDDYDASDPSCCTITDWKFTSTWSVIDGKPKPEWEAQLNIYAEFYRRLGFPVHRLQIVAILKDWSRRKAKQAHDGDNYPIVPVRIVPVPMWPSEDVDLFIRRRIREHVSARLLPDDKLPLCTPEERWQSPPRWAVVKNNAGRATKLHDTKEEAEEHCAALQRSGKGRYHVEERPSEPTRCSEYCLVNRWCDWYQRTVAKSG